MALNKYSSTLNGDVLKRYFEKTNKIGYDPYELETKFFVDNRKSLPVVSYYDVMNYFILGKSAYTESQKRNHKSMDSYKLIIDGWVREVLFREENNYYVVRSKVL